MTTNNFELPPIIGEMMERMNELRKMVSECNDWIDENVAHSEQTPYTFLCDAESHLNLAIQSVSDFVGCCAKSVMYGEKVTLPTSNVESDERQD